MRNIKIQQNEVGIGEAMVLTSIGSSSPMRAHGKGPIPML